MKQTSGIRINQSLIKQFIKNGNDVEYCPKKVGSIYILNTHKSRTSDAMVKGQFFETLCLGTSTGGVIVDSLPLKRNGEKSIDQIRIEAQALVFRELLPKYSIDFNKIIDRPVFKKIINDDFYLSMEADFISNIEYDGNKIDYAIHDLKLTQNIHNQYGDFCWAYPANMDHIQAAMYNFITGLPFFYWVFDFKPTPEFKIFHKEIRPDEKMQLLVSIDKTIDIITENNKIGWEAYCPSISNCSKCPLYVECSHRQEAPKITSI